jgi:hypothetical protein
MSDITSKVVQFGGKNKTIRGGGKLRPGERSIAYTQGYVPIGTVHLNINVLALMKTVHI